MRIGVIDTGKLRATRSGYGLLRVKGYHDNCRDDLLAAWGVSVYAPGSQDVLPINDLIGRTRPSHFTIE